MNIVINASNIKVGGGIQVADSICRELYKYQQHSFIVVLSSYLKETYETVKHYSNAHVFIYNIKNNFSTLIFGRDRFLDNLVVTNNVDAIFTVFGPSRWEPRVPHLCGFARAQLVVPESPFYQRMSLVEKGKEKLVNGFIKYLFGRKKKNLFTENPFITERVGRLFIGNKVFTVTNYYNQVFDNPAMWVDKKLRGEFDGTTLLTVASAYPHKNLEIAVEAARILKLQHPGFKFRFVFTISKENLKADTSGAEECFVFLGTVDISECPSLYKKCDIAFQPTLIECFTATYPEAMRMEKPIVTTDLGFAHGICGDAACYYSAVDAQACANAIYKVATDKQYAAQLVSNGKRQLGTFDSYTQRADKLIGFLEEMTYQENR